MGFLVTGAVMFLWLLVFGQWRRLRPLYLPSGILLFLAIAAPRGTCPRRPDAIPAGRTSTSSMSTGSGSPTRATAVPALLVLHPDRPRRALPLDGVPLERPPRRAGRRLGAPQGECGGLVLRDLGGLHLPVLQRVPVKADPLHPAGVSADRRPHRPVDRGDLAAPDSLGRMRPGLRVFGFLCGLLAAALCVAVLKARDHPKRHPGRRSPSGPMPSSWRACSASVACGRSFRAATTAAAAAP
jgi:hypothetical protein